VRQEGYGRKRRSSIDSSSNEFDSLEISDQLETEEEYGRRRRSSPNQDPFRFRVEGENGRRRRSPQNKQVLPATNVESQNDQIAVESVSALNFANILKIAGAKATPIVRQEGYGRKRRSSIDSSSNEFDSLEISDQLETEEEYGRRRRSSPNQDPFRFRVEGENGRRRRSPQNKQVLPATNVESQNDQIAVESVSALNFANILKIAGAKATPIVRQEGYGRKRRSPMDSSSNDFDSLEVSEKFQSSSPSGGSDKRRKRSPQFSPAYANAHQYGMVDTVDSSSVSVKPHGKYGDIQKILPLSGAIPQKISRGVSYGRKKRSKEDLSNEIITNEIQTGTGLVKNVAIEAVKIKSHGNYGNIAQIYDAGAKSKNVVFNGRFGRRKREDIPFIPFNVYDERRVNTLKIEQNDFLALQSRLQIEKANSDRNVKKRHFTANQ